MAQNRFHGGKVMLAAAAVLLTVVRASSTSSSSSSLALLVAPPILPGRRRARTSSSSHWCSPDGGGSPHANNESLLFAATSVGGDDDDDDVDARTSTVPRPPPRGKGRRHGHSLAILTMPHSASARIANEAILETAMSVTSRRLSVVLRATASVDDDDDEDVMSLTQLRRYAGEVYSMAWDAAFGLDERERGNKDDGDDDASIDDDVRKIASGGELLDLIVYIQNMPNSPPEGWIDLRPDLTCVCSHDSITGWVTPSSRVGGSGRAYASSPSTSSAQGGLREHVEAVNAERASRGLGMLEALHVENWPDGADVVGDPNIVFLEDDDARIRGGGGGGGGASSLLERRRRKKHEADDDEDDGPIGPGGTAIPPSSLYSSVCVGGTFDGMHYGHRKLLTLAVSSVQPVTGRLLIGVTRDEMLTHKAYADRIPSLDDRIAGVLDFVGNLAPGMKNRIRCVPISDEYGPPGQPVDSRVYPGLANDFDALVLSHETLPTGRKLNAYREGVLGLRPLKLLCTQRTEPHGMSSTALRRMRTKERM